MIYNSMILIYGRISSIIYNKTVLNLPQKKRQLFHLLRTSNTHPQSCKWFPYWFSLKCLGIASHVSFLNSVNRKMIVSIGLPWTQLLLFFFILGWNNNPSPAASNKVPCSLPDECWEFQQFQKRSWRWAVDLALLNGTLKCCSISVQEKNIHSTRHQQQRERSNALKNIFVLIVQEFFVNILIFPFSLL